MQCLPCNDRGIGLIEVVIAIFITAIGLTGMLLLQAPAWKTAAKSDFTGRAVEIMQRQLETTEAFIMNQCNTVTAGTTSDPAVITSGLSSPVAGDAKYTVNTTITSIGVNIWRVTVTVSWPTNTTGIRGNLVVARQAFFRAGC